MACRSGGPRPGRAARPPREPRTWDQSRVRPVTGGKDASRPGDPPEGSATSAGARMHSRTGLFTDHYELTMVQAALRDGTAGRPCVFELFARRLPEGRRYGVVAGTARVLEALAGFHFHEDELAHLAASGVIDERTCEWLRSYRFSGDIHAYREGDLYFPGSPVLTIESTFAEGVV